MTDRVVIACNYIDGTAIVPEGARAYVTLPNYGGGHDRIEVLVRSRGGRWVRKYEDIRRLSAFRCKTLVPEHARYEESLWDHMPVLMAEQLQARADELRAKREGV